MHPRVKGIKVCLNEGPNPFSRGDYYKKTENTLTKLKEIFFSRTTEPILTNFGTKHPWVRIQMKKQLVIIKLIFYFSSPNQRYDIIICVY